MPGPAVAATRPLYDADQLAAWAGGRNGICWFRTRKLTVRTFELFALATSR